MQKRHQHLASAFSALGHPTRIRIIELLSTQDSVVPTLIAESLEIPLATASHNLNRLHAAGWLNRQITGRYVFYSINTKLLESVKEFL